MKSFQITIVVCSLIAAVCPAIALPNHDASLQVPTQEWSFAPGPRSATAYVHYPGKSLEGVNPKTGLMLSLHNWGGTHHRGAPNPSVLADRYNVVAICVDYLQSGHWDPESDGPYDFGFLQSIDALRALHAVWSGLEGKGISFHRGRIYACGGSGGGNVTLMANKLAPRTFACVIDLSGMAKLNDDIAYAQPGASKLNAGYSQNRDSPRYLSPHEQEIRFIGDPRHLETMKSLGNTCRIAVVHGQEDKVCPIEDVREMVSNMDRAGLKVEGHFMGKEDLDGAVFKDDGHSLGDRTRILQHVADRFLLPDSPDSRVRLGLSDFDLKDAAVRYPVTNGVYTVSYENGFPEILFEKSR